MKLIVIGAVAGGTSAAAKARRNDDNAEIVIYEKDKDISYSSCGLPYYIGGEVEDIDSLTPRDPAFFKKKYNIDVFHGHEVVKLDPNQKVVTVKKLSTGETFDDSYDKLVIATGATPFVPGVEGGEQEHVFVLRNVEHARKIRRFIDEKKPKRAVIAGTGFIGFEMLENVMAKDIEVTIVEKMSKITPNLDEDMASYLEDILKKKKITILKDTTITEIKSDKVVLADEQELSCDMIIMATGIKPNVKIAEDAGIDLGETGAIKVNKRMQTNLDEVYACGDCIETFSVITGKPVYRPLGSTANKTGRIAGDVLSGGKLQYRGNLGTSIYKIFDLTVASTGLSEKEAEELGYNTVTSHNIKPDKPAYFNGTEMCIKTIADRETERILGVQIVGREGVDKRIDVFVTLITYGAKVEELFHLDLAYAPPFSTTKDPIHYSGMILDNALNNGRSIRTTEDVQADIDQSKPIQIIDTRVSKQYETAHVDCAVNVPHAEIRNKLSELDKDIPTVTYCNSGTTGNAVQNILINHGFKDVSNLSGGHKFYRGTKKEDTK
ncbi:NADPH-dependent 2,4-dienoyl-CoA reductase/sulfur reductase-like enzyme/rhodanese-related sulfurtransferase [Natronobacillus azotifigens]|uniref:FAD-dependent oxidoreductase n=1 Tax=Natronobacillus azotifigens TaxID=472978 RepID=A0A9J6RCU3_9BACI|nr:FAD-dependent oxidoreductase [Natronobacillus azotifigens]MCZ0703116.1 FAD-dependent oxidoreductase [Natronobacillus azotifigens]